MQYTKTLMPDYQSLRSLKARIGGDAMKQRGIDELGRCVVIAFQTPQEQLCGLTCTH
jgi:hypothetical protein